MADIFRFPNGGYEVNVCRKADIIDGLDLNTIDKELMLAIVTQCEKDAIKFYESGRWVGIPFLGNFRVPKYKQKFNEIQGAELLSAAKQELDNNEYKTFKKELIANIAIDIDRERLYRYKTSNYIHKHKIVYYRHLKDRRIKPGGDKEAFARFICYSLIDLKPFNYTE